MPWYIGANFVLSITRILDINDRVIYSAANIMGMVYMHIMTEKS